MNKIQQALKSRTFWTIFITVVMNTLNANTQFISPQTLEIFNAIFAVIATYFHINPSQNYKG